MHALHEGWSVMLVMHMIVTGASPDVHMLLCVANTCQTMRDLVLTALEYLPKHLQRPLNITPLRHLQLLRHLMFRQTKTDCRGAELRSCDWVWLDREVTTVQRLWDGGFDVRCFADCWFEFTYLFRHWDDDSIIKILCRPIRSETMAVKVGVDPANQIRMLADVEFEYTTPFNSMVHAAKMHVDVLQLLPNYMCDELADADALSDMYSCAQPKMVKMRREAVKRMQGKALSWSVYLRIMELTNLGQLLPYVISKDANERMLHRMFPCRAPSTNHTTLRGRRGFTIK